MKKRRAILLTLLALLLVGGILTGLLVREYRHEQASHALIAAIKADDTPAALAALKAGADPNARDHSRDKPRSVGERMKQLLDKVLHPNAKAASDTCQTALLLHFNVSAQDNPALVHALLDAGADPNLPGHMDAPGFGMWMAISSTPLIRAAADRNHTQSLRLLLQHGGDARGKDSDGVTALHYAVICGNKEAITLLLDAGADIDAQANDGSTPLHEACEDNDFKNIALLLQHHANPNLRNRSGATPLSIALRPDDTRMSDLLRKAGAKTGKELDAVAKH